MFNCDVVYDLSSRLIFKNENFEINELSYFDIPSDLDIGKIDDKHLFDVLSKIDVSDSDALFVSCTALPVLSLINELEKKLGKFNCSQEFSGFSSGKGCKNGIELYCFSAIRFTLRNCFCKIHCEKRKFFIYFF